MFSDFPNLQNLMPKKNESVDIVNSVWLDWSWGHIKGVLNGGSAALRGETCHWTFSPRERASNIALHTPSAPTWDGKKRNFYISGPQTGNRSISERQTTFLSSTVQNLSPCFWLFLGALSALQDRIANITTQEIYLSSKLYIVHIKTTLKSFAS